MLRVAASEPELILEAFVVSVVALVANDTLLVLVQVIAPVLESEQSLESDVEANAVPPALPTSVCPAVGVAAPRPNGKELAGSVPDMNFPSICCAFAIREQ